MADENVLTEEFVEDNQALVEDKQVPVEDNQALLFIQNLVLVLLDYSSKYTMAVLHFVFYPVLLVLAPVGRISDKIFLIARNIVYEIFSYSSVLPLFGQVLFYSCATFLKCLAFDQKPEIITAEVERKIYRRIKLIITTFHGLPLEAEHAVALYSIVKKIPIFGKYIPFPNFLFEQTFKAVNFQPGLINVTLSGPAPKMEHEETQESGAQSSTSTDGGSRGVVKKRKTVTIASPQDTEISHQSDDRSESESSSQTALSSV